MRKVIVLFVTFFFLICVVLSYFYWPSIQYRWQRWTVTKEEQQQQIQKTKDLLNHDKPDEALVIIQKYADSIENHSEIGKEWLELLIRASSATFNIPQLITLYEYYPKAFDANEKASQLVANAYIASGRPRDYQTIRESWKGRETKQETWFVLDADKLLQEGKSKEAIDLLKSRSFPGKADTPRLIHLALLSILENPKDAWDYLTQAYNKDPENPEIVSYRAKFLETLGKNSQALYEYLAAVHLDSKNVYLKDQLAEFYLRQKQYPYALEVWKETLQSSDTGADFIWTKALFWSKVVMPLHLDWRSIKRLPGKLDPYIDYLESLKPQEFWNQKSFEKLTNFQQYLNTQQSTYWLRIFQYLKEGKEKEAYALVRFNPFAAFSWSSHLERALKRILLYKETGKLTAEEEKTLKEPIKSEIVFLPEGEPYFFEQLEILAHTSPKEESKIPEDLKALLKSPEAFSAALLSAGWDEAALSLSSMEAYPPTFPDWVAFNMTQAIKRNRGNEAALKYASLQKPSPALSMLISELLIASHKYEPALERLKQLYKDPSEIGKRSAWLMSLIYIDLGEYKEAENTISSQPLFEKEMTGQETLARIALLQGKVDQAEKIYLSIEDRSPEAKSYLARKAFAAKDWKKARELTEDLLREYPTNTLLQENYKKIMDEQNKSTQQK